MSIRFAGLDWASRTHAACVIDEHGSVHLQFEVNHDAAGLAEIGFSPCATVKAAKHYPAADMPAICQALIHHLQGVMAEA